MIVAVRGEIHGLTLGVGTTLVGVCVDYPIHLAGVFLVERHRGGHAQGPAITSVVLACVTSGSRWLPVLAPWSVRLLGP